MGRIRSGRLAFVGSGAVGALAGVLVWLALRAAGPVLAAEPSAQDEAAARPPLADPLLEPGGRDAEAVRGDVVPDMRPFPPGPLPEDSSEPDVDADVDGVEGRPPLSDQARVSPNRGGFTVLDETFADDEWPAFEPIAHHRHPPPPPEPEWMTGDDFERDDSSEEPPRGAGPAGRGPGPRGGGGGPHGGGSGGGRGGRGGQGRGGGRCGR